MATFCFIITLLHQKLINDTYNNNLNSVFREDFIFGLISRLG